MEGLGLKASPIKNQPIKRSSGIQIQTEEEVFDDSNTSLEDFFAVYPSLDEEKNRSKIQLILASKAEFNPHHIQEDAEVMRGGKYKHQVVAFRFIIAFPRVLLMHGTGSGKTCIFITASEYYRQLSLKGRGPIKRALVIVPNKAVEDDFKRQLICSCTAVGTYDTEYVRSATSTKTRKTRINQLVGEFYTIITYRSLAIWLKANDDNPELIKRTYSNTIIFFDEVQSINSEEDQREDGGAKEPTKSKKRQVKSTKVTNKEAYYYIEKMFDMIEDSKIVLASGTPMLNEIYEMVDVLNLLLKPNKKIKGIASDNYIEILEAIRINSRGLVSYVKEPESAVSIEYPDSHNLYEQFIPPYAGLDEFEMMTYKSLNTPLQWISAGILFKQEAFVIPMSSYQKKVYLLVEGRLRLETNETKKANYLSSIKKLSTVSNLVYPVVLTDPGRQTYDIATSDLSEYYEKDIYPEVSEIITSGKIHSMYLDETNKITVQRFNKILTINGLSFKINSIYDLLKINAVSMPYQAQDGSLVAQEVPMLYNFSPKNHFLISYALEEEKVGAPRVHYIYCEPIRPSGVTHLELSLEANGFVRFEPQEKGMTVNVGSGVCVTTETVYNINDRVGDYKRFATITSTTTPNTRDTIFSVLNSRDNWDGRLLRFIIATSAIKVGVNLFNVSNIHIWNGHWNPGRVKQARNRALRGISQRFIQERIGGQPTVRVMYYTSGYTIGVLTSDELGNPLITTVKDQIQNDILGTLIVDVNGNPLEDSERTHAKIYSKAGWEAMKIIGFISPDLDQYAVAREKEYNIKLAETVAAKNSFDCRLNLTRNGLELGFCESSDDAPLPDDTSTYDTYFADSDVEWISNIIESVLRKFYTVSVRDLLLLMKSLRKVNEKYFYLSVYQLVHSKNSFMDYFGRKCYVREEGGSLFLTSNQETFDNIRDGESELTTSKQVKSTFTSSQSRYNVAYYDRFLITERILSSESVLDEYVVEGYEPKLEGLKEELNETLAGLLNSEIDINFIELHDSIMRIIREFIDSKQITWLMKNVVDTFMTAYGDNQFFPYLLPYPGAILYIIRGGGEYDLFNLDPNVSPSPFYYACLFALSNYIYATIKPDLINNILNTKVNRESTGKKKMFTNSPTQNIKDEQIEVLISLFNSRLKAQDTEFTPIITILVPYTRSSGVGYNRLADYSNAKGNIYYRSFGPSSDEWTEIPETSGEYSGFNLMLKYIIYSKLERFDLSPNNQFKMWAVNLSGYLKIKDLYGADATKKKVQAKSEKLTIRKEMKGQNCNSLDPRILARFSYVLGIRELYIPVNYDARMDRLTLERTATKVYGEYGMANWTDEEIYAAMTIKVAAANKERVTECQIISQTLFYYEAISHFNFELPSILQFITDIENPSTIAIMMTVRERTVGYLVVGY